MIRRAAVAWVAVGAAACSSSGGASLVAGLRSPAAVVTFLGVSPSGSGQGVVPMVAVASSHGNELKLVDPSTDTVVRAPTVIFGLSVPTLPRPIFLASASLADGGADLLAVASGGTVVQLVATWLGPSAAGTPGMGVVTSWELGPLVGAGSQIVSLVGAQVPGAPAVGTPPVAPAQAGRARLLVGFSRSTDGTEGKLVVLEFARGANGSVEPSGSPEVLPLGFDPVAMAAAPDRLHVYCATGDPIPDASGRPVFGVAEIDASGAAPSAWTVRGLDGRGPTVSVAAAILGERTADPETFGPPVLRVYAALEPSGCGPERAIACGVATFDPALGGLALDPSPPGPVPAQPFRTPLFVPTIPLSMAIAMPPATGSQRCTDACPDRVNANGYPQPLLVLAPTSGQRWTTAAASVTTGDAGSYIQDLGRYSAPDDVSLMNQEETRTKVSSANNVTPIEAPSGPYLALWSIPGTGPLPPASSKPVYLNADLPAAFIVWPGFTPSGTWSLVWQGPLPGLNARVGGVGKLPDGTLYVAVQEPLGTAWIPGAYVGSPDLGVHAADMPGDPGDFARFLPDPDPQVDACAIPVEKDQPAVSIEARIASLLPPDPARFPGGALALVVPPADAGTDANAVALRCLASRIQPGEWKASIVTVLASGLVLSSSSLGYAGRPRLDVRYDFAWQPEEALSGEALVLARKARRFYYPSEPPCKVDPATGQRIPCYPGFPELTDPLQPGPVVGFRPAVYCPDANPCPAGTSPARGAYILFTTQSGLVPMSRRPTGASVGVASTTFDKSVYPSQEFLGTVFYEAYAGNALFMLPPGQAYNQAKIIR